MNSVDVPIIIPPEKLRSRQSELEQQKGELSTAYHSSAALAAYSNDAAAKSAATATAAQLREVEGALGAVSNSIREDLTSRRSDAAYSVPRTRECRALFASVIAAEAERLASHAALVDVYIRGSRHAIFFHPALPSSIVGDVHVLTEWTRELLRIGILTKSDLPQGGWLMARIEEQA